MSLRDDLVRARLSVSTDLSLTAMPHGLIGALDSAIPADADDQDASERFVAMLKAMRRANGTKTLLGVNSLSHSHVMRIFDKAIADARSE